MADTPCGCDIEEKASAVTDPRGASVLRADAKSARGGWRCDGGACDVTEDQLSDTQRAALRRVESIVGARVGELTRCPGSYARERDADHGARLFRWFDKGQLSLRCPHPTGAEVDAIDLIASGVAARERSDIERSRRSIKGTKDEQ